MSRRDIITLLERLSLDHRASLAEKACSYLLSVESNRTIKSLPSHAAICVDIAAEQLDIEVSRQALVRMSGAPSPVAYNSILQSIRRELLGDRASSTPTSSSAIATAHTISSAGAGATGGGNVSAYQAIVDLITMDNFAILKQLSIKRGSMELDRLVLDCLSQFFDKWVASLTPAQRAHVDYADLKWVGAAFWLCSMARQRQVKAVEPASAEPNTDAQLGGSKQKAASGAPKRLGGKGAKELKEMVLDMLQHRVTSREFDKTIKLMEDTVGDYLQSLGIQKKPTASGGARKAARATTTNTTTTTAGGRKRIVTDQDSGGSMPASAASSDTEANATTAPVSATDRRKTAAQSSHDTTTPGRRVATKRTISNVSDISLEGGAAAVLEGGDEGSAVATEVPSTSISSARPPAAKRARMQGDKTPKSRASAASTATASSTPLMTTGRRAGNVFTMIPRVKYQQTKAYQHYVEWRKQVLERLSA